MSRAVTFGLLLSVLLVIAPHALHLPLWISGTCALLLSWRAYLAYHSGGGHDTLLAKQADRRNGRPATLPAPKDSPPPCQSGQPLPSPWLLRLITVTCIAGILLEFHTLFGREAGVALLMLLAALKLMELRSARDAMVLIYLACFSLITGFFYSQGIPSALYMLATLFVILATWMQVYAPNIAIRARLRNAAAMLLQAAPLALVLFVLFPRISGPLWGLPQDAWATSGLDDRMAPGSFSRLILSDAVAFRVSFSGPAPRRDRMYWRGPVLWDYDGRTWTRGVTIAAVPPQLGGLAQPVEYSVMLEPHNKNWLFALEMPDKVSVSSRLSSDFRLLSSEPVHALLRYQARSFLGYRANVDESAAQLQRALQLPDDLDPRARRLAAQWRAQGGSDAAVMRRALDYFHRQPFRYTLEPAPLGANGVDDFLFDTREGFCEHYAGAFVFLMRAAQIPARVVTGYQGGEFNGLGNYYIVRQSDAHAWAEVWLAGQGWLRIDPTAAVAPDRVERGLAAAMPADAALPFMIRNPPTWLLRLRLNWDAVVNQWNLWVVGYNYERQFALLTRLGMESVTWQKMTLQMLLGVGLLFALFSLYLLRHLFTRHPDRVQAAWLGLCRKLARAGVPRAAYEGAQDYAARVSAMRPDLARAIRDLAARYTALRYENAPDAAALREFIRRCARFRAPRPRRARGAML